MSVYMLLYNCFILSQFNYCPIIWMFCNKIYSPKKILSSCCLVRFYFRFSNFYSKHLRFLYKAVNNFLETLYTILSNWDTIFETFLKFLQINLFITIISQILWIRDCGVRKYYMKSFDLMIFHVFMWFSFWYFEIFFS